MSVFGHMMCRRGVILFVAAATLLALLTVTLRAQPPDSIPRFALPSGVEPPAESKTAIHADDAALDSHTVDEHSPAAVHVDLSQTPISIVANIGQRWSLASENVAILRGSVSISQGSTRLAARHAVFWHRDDADDNSQRANAAAAGRSSGDSRQRILVYLEGDVLAERGDGSFETQDGLLVELSTTAGISIHTPSRITADGADEPLYKRAVQARRVEFSPHSLNSHAADADSPLAAGPLFRLAQYQPTEIEEPFNLQPLQSLPKPGSIRRFRVSPRSLVRPSIESRPNPQTTPPEQIIIVTGGANVVIDGGGFALPSLSGDVGAVDLTADRIVIWTQDDGNAELMNETIQTTETPLQVYLEGNIVIRQGDSVIRASQAFYDAVERRAYILDAELKTRIPNTPGNVRLRAQELRQLGDDTYQATSAWISTSEYGKPGYRVQMSNVFIEPRYSDPWSSPGGPQIDAETGQPLGQKSLWATTLNNTFLVGDVPLFYFPYASAPAEDPNIPLRTVRFGNDRVFGTQFYTTWNFYKLFGVQSIPGTRLDLHADYLSKRGPSGGLSGSYNGTERFGLEGAYRGSGLAMLTYDNGLDRLGRDRIDLQPQQSLRGRFNLRDRQDFGDITWRGEASFLSDRNYLEQYSKLEYDTAKDYETYGYLKQDRQFFSWSLLTQPRPYNYFNQTEWLPRLDLYALNNSLLDGRVNYSGRTTTAFATTRPADAPPTPNDLFSTLPWEGTSNTLFFDKRASVTAPFMFGPAKIAPYLLGDVTAWSQDYTGNGLTRLYGAAGVRASIEFTKSFPGVSNGILNLNGLAHKMVFDADYSFADSNQDLAVIPQLNEFDDNAQEQFRRRLLQNTFGGNLPATLDPRFFAVRSGAVNGVADPYSELVDSRQALRLGWRHRLQTKTGPIQNQRIKNWMTLDLESTFFPNPNRDNFGQDFGLFGVRYNWNVGDRTAITASSQWDIFDNAAQIWNVGLISQRSSRGSVYLGVRNLEAGPLKSQIVTASYSYTLSPKWVSTLSTQYDLGENQNRGQTFTLTRVGADFLFHIGGAIDPNRNNVGIAFSIEPRFASFTGTSGMSLGSLLGQTAQAPR